MKSRNKPFIIAGVILLVLALAVFLIGGVIAGWDFAAFFRSQAFVWICVFLGAYLFGIIAMIIIDRIKKL